jgi:hypothetical protein
MPTTSPADSSRKLILRVVTRPGTTPEKIARDLHDLYQALNEYHLAHGGSGLSVDDFQYMVSSAVAEGV